MTDAVVVVMTVILITMRLSMNSDLETIQGRRDGRAAFGGDWETWGETRERERERMRREESMSECERKGLGGREIEREKEERREKAGEILRE